MDEQRDRSGQLPPLPAQYHYKDDTHGTEVIYLAGGGSDGRVGGRLRGSV